mmetsp:Transcript_117091/g.326201  ORF Transcript_117091/g.326201 Transcript_117091/m.326201 type:complete len:230 (+) Transcript_117091:711-1400(+)
MGHKHGGPKDLPAHRHGAGLEADGIEIASARFVPRLPQRLNLGILAESDPAPRCPAPGLVLLVVQQRLLPPLGTVASIGVSRGLCRNVQEEADQIMDAEQLGTDGNAEHPNAHGAARGRLHAQLHWPDAIVGHVHLLHDLIERVPHHHPGVIGLDVPTVPLQRKAQGPMGCVPLAHILAVGADVGCAVEPGQHNQRVIEGDDEPELQCDARHIQHHHLHSDRREGQLVP